MGIVRKLYDAIPANQQITLESYYGITIIHQVSNAIDCIIYPRYPENTYTVVSDPDNMIGSKISLSKATAGPLIITTLTSESLIVTQIGISGMG